MNLSDQVCSLELAKKLKELGVKQDSLFYYSDKHYLIGGNDLNGYEIRADLLCKQQISAFTVAELIDMLPDEREVHIGKNTLRYAQKWGKKYYASTLAVNYPEYEDFYEEKLSDVIAKIVIYLIENGSYKNVD